MCVALAAFLAPDRSAPFPPVQVTLRMPPPLEHPLAVRRSEGRAELLDGEALVASAEVVPADQAPDPVPGTPGSAGCASSTRP